MANILLTGFSPFDNELMNPSWEAVKQFESKAIMVEHLVHTVQLPCEFGTAISLLQEKIAELQPEVVICVGQAGGRAEISLERVAINVDDARIPDNAGAQPVDQAIAQDGPAAYFTSLPIKAIVKKLRDEGIPANVSQSAGTYVCNHVFYGLMHTASKNTNIQRAGFVHIPYLPNQAANHPGAPSLSLENAVTAIALLLETTLSQRQDIQLSTGSIC